MIDKQDRNARLRDSLKEEQVPAKRFISKEMDIASRKEAERVNPIKADEEKEALEKADSEKDLAEKEAASKQAEEKAPKDSSLKNKSSEIENEPVDMEAYFRCYPKEKLFYRSADGQVFLSDDVSVSFARNHQKKLKGELKIIKRK